MSKDIKLFKQRLTVLIREAAAYGDWHHPEQWEIVERQKERLIEQYLAKSKNEKER